MKWDILEDTIVCKYYLNNKTNWRKNIHLLMKELKDNGFPLRDIGSTKMRISNFEYLDRGVGLSNASKQSISVYNKLK